MYRRDVVLAAGSTLLGIEALITNVLLLFVWFAMAGMSTIAIEWRLAPCTAGYLAAFLAAARWPEHRHWLMAGSNLVLTINAVWIWWPEDISRRRERGRQMSAQQRKPVE